jgi:hypothetical protein
MVLSFDPDAICLLSGEKATALTESEWPVSVFWRSPVVMTSCLFLGDIL